MSTRWTLAASTAVAALAVAGCASSPPEYDPAPGTLVAGTAQITVNGNDLGITDTVQCDPAGTLTMMRTRDPDDPDAPGISAIIASEDELVVRGVGINDLGGFTGSYNRGLGGEATVSMTGRTYDISGTADGFDTDNPSFRTTGNFQIKIAC
ncbi:MULTISPECIES: lipoprotein LpqH [Mycolicibacterium]|uniref:lipoprotein LpqH n=1 Tax=Mycolicibacterium TaxID=1866885 RepID=UPI001C3CB64F|nr:lipoprotein LpqH [Mycolicibacterium sp. PAM1]MBV5242039.1 lipoprotein LpqH [Mycolicibacterium sp. PAM1]